jgi:phage baseplate assembly protein W
MATINRKVRTFSDLNLTFGAHPATGDVLKRYDEDAVKNSIRHLILTKNFERPFHPELGCQVYNLMFENYTAITSELARRTIEAVLTAYEPRAKIIDIRLDPSEDNNEMSITVEFMIINSDRPLTVTTFLNRVR